MNTHTLSDNIKRYSIIAKMKVVIMMLFSAMVGMLITPIQAQNSTNITYGLLGIGLHAIASAAFNQIFEQQIDQKMQRTQHRPLVQETLPKNTVTQVAITCSILGTGVLWYGTTSLATILTCLTTLSYSYIYTKILKPNTPQNIVIGGLSGAMPPLLGWTCIEPTLHVKPLILVLIIFTWTPAHFWPLAIHNIEDYRLAGLPMLPVTHGVKFTTHAILSYGYLCAACTLLPYCIGMCSIHYLVIASIYNIKWLYLCHQLHQTQQRPMKVFLFSIQYLYSIFGLILIDHFSQTVL